MIEMRNIGVVVLAQCSLPKTPDAGQTARIVRDNSVGGQPLVLAIRHIVVEARSPTLIAVDRYELGAVPLQIVELDTQVVPGPAAARGDWKIDRDALPDGQDAVVELRRPRPRCCRIGKGSLQGRHSEETGSIFIPSHWRPPPSRKRRVTLDASPGSRTSISVSRAAAPLINHRGQ